MSRVLRRRCECCGRKVIYVSKLIAAASFRNPFDCDYPIELAAGALACRRCVEHNDHAKLANPQKPATTRKRCHRCGGTGKIRNPLQPGSDRVRRRPVNAITGTYDSLQRRNLYCTCPRCAGHGKVAAA